MIITGWFMVWRRCVGGTGRTAAAVKGIARGTGNLGRVITAAGSKRSVPVTRTGEEANIVATAVAAEAEAQGGINIAMTLGATDVTGVTTMAGEAAMAVAAGTTGTVEIANTAETGIVIGLALTTGADKQASGRHPHRVARRDHHWVCSVPGTRLWACFRQLASRRWTKDDEYAFAP